MTKELMCYSFNHYRTLPSVIFGLEQAVAAEAWMTWVPRKDHILPEQGTSMPYYQLETRAVSSGEETTLEKFPFKHS